MSSSGSYTLPKAATEGFADGASYDAYRPSYPDEAVEMLLCHLRISDLAGAHVVEIASGTGKFTEALARREEGYEVLAVEPHADMRKELEAKRLPGVEVKDGHAEGMPVANGWGDACIAAQSFHWFSTIKALKEIHRVLREGAVFGMIWNIEDYNKPQSWKASTAWEQKLNDMIHTLPRDDTPRFRDEKWSTVFDQQGSKSSPLQAVFDSIINPDRLPRFSLPLGEERVPFTVWLTDEALWKRLGTLSHVAVLKGEEREKFKVGLNALLKEPGVERNSKGELALHGITFLAWTDKL